MTTATRRILLIDGSPDEVSPIFNFCARAKWPETVIETYDPGFGPPPEDYRWGDFDLLVIADDLGIDDASGVAWLRALGARDTLPSTIVLLEAADEQRTREAVEVGANGVLNKLELSPLRFTEVVDRMEPVHRGETRAATRGDDPALAETMVNTSGGLLAPELMAAITEAPDDDIDVRVPRYRPIRALSKSGIARIFLAEDLEGDRGIVVLKALPLNAAADATVRRRFIREYRYVERIRHPSVIQVFEQGFTADFAYIAMEYCPHGTLVERIEGGLDEADAVMHIRQIAAGLGAVHLQGICHRDVKPANCLMRTPQRAVLADFGIAKGEYTVQALTGNSDFFGTFFYTSPEQLRGEDNDQRGDLYSLGIMMYQMLTGELPWASRSLAALLQAHLSEPMPRLPSELARYQPIVDGLTAKDVAARTQNTAALLEQFDALG